MDRLPAQLNAQLQIKGRNRDKGQSNAGSQNRYAGPRSQSGDAAASEISVLRGSVSAFVDCSGACASSEFEG
jgi:hypothetical protein